MSQDRKRVVWFEGMTLDPHHLQQWDRYQQSMLTARVRSVARFDWGLLSLEIDRDALANGDFVLVRCSGVMPDGFYFEIPDSDALPTPRGIGEHFAPTDDRLPVYLAVPLENRSGSNVLLQGAPNRQETRYAAETIPVPDANTGADERQIEVARANLRIRLGREPLGAYSTIQIAEIRRSGSGTFVLSDTFVPPCLSIAASERLMTMARRLLELLVAKSGEFGERQRAVIAQRELSPSDLVALMLNTTVNTYIPLLNHHFTASQGHPEDLYKAMLLLAGQLTAWVANAPVAPRDLPTYDHARPSDSFNRLEAILREMLGAAAAPSNYVQIRLDKQRENLFTAQVDAGVLQQAQFFLIARSDRIPEDVLITEMPRMLRIASPQTIDAVLRSYTRALAIEPTNRLPSGMPVDGQANYFQLQKRGPFWEAIQESGAMSIFVPAEFSEVGIQLVAVNRP